MVLHATCYRQRYERFSIALFLDDDIPRVDKYVYYNYRWVLIWING